MLNSSPFKSNCSMQTCHMAYSGSEWFVMKTAVLSYFDLVDL